MSDKKKAPKKKGKKSPEPSPSLEQWGEERAEARYKENQHLVRSNRELRSIVAVTEQELKEAHRRLSLYENPLQAKAEQVMRKVQSISRDELATQIGCSTEDADALLRDLSARGYNVVDGVLSRYASMATPEVDHFYGDSFKFGIVSDTHLGNHHAMEDQLQEAYEVFRREGVTSVYCPGNLLDGEKTYRGQEYEIKVMGVENVVQYLARVWPKVPGITTYHVASSTCHEGYYLKSAGVLIGKLIEMERPDMVYLGLDEADVVLHDSEARPRLRIVHPGGGTGYADSYRPQKIVESYAGADKPAILAIGHYHKSGFYDIRDVQVIQAGCLETQTPFMRKRSLRAALGFWIVEVQFTEHGSLRRFRPEWFKYYLNAEGNVLRDWTI